MSEFKGTKGKWYFNNDVQVYSGYRNIYCNGIKIHESSNMEGLSEKEIEANALLISKAPEMLEMLERILKEGVIPHLDIAELIKQATEI